MPERPKRTTGVTSLLDGLSRHINQGVEVALAFCGTAMTLIVALQVFCRYGLNHSLFWSEELARYLLVWLTFLGASVAYFRGAHPGIDLFVSRVPSVLRRWITAGAHLVTGCVSLVMIISGIQFAWFVRFQISPALSLPKWAILAIVPVSGMLLLVHCTAALARTFAGGHHDR